MSWGAAQGGARERAGGAGVSSPLAGTGIVAGRGHLTVAAAAAAARTHVLGRRGDHVACQEDGLGGGGHGVARGALGPLQQRLGGDALLPALGRLVAIEGVGAQRPAQRRGVRLRARAQRVGAGGQLAGERGVGPQVGGVLQNHHHPLDAALGAGHHADLAVLAAEPRGGGPRLDRRRLGRQPRGVPGLGDGVDQGHIAVSRRALHQRLQPTGQLAETVGLPRRRRCGHDGQGASGCDGGSRNARKQDLGRVPAGCWFG